MNILKHKKVIWGLVAISLLLPVTSFAQVQMNSGQSEFSLNAVDTAAPQTGTAFALPSNCTMYTWNTSFATQPTSHTTQLQISNDNSTWLVGDSTTNVLGDTRTIFSAAKFLRVVETARVGGSFITSTVICKTSPGSAGSLVPTNQILAINGTTSAPGYSFSQGLNSTFDGFWRLSAGAFGVTAQGNANILWSSKQLMASTYPLCWAPTTDITLSQQTSSADTGMGRLGAGMFGMRTCDIANQPSFSASYFANPASSILTIAAATVTPTNGIHHIAGAALLSTITVPATCTPTCTVQFIPDAAYTYDAAGNIRLPIGGGTAVVNKVMTFVWDGAKWNPSY